MRCKARLWTQLRRSGQAQRSPSGARKRKLQPPHGSHERSVTTNTPEQGRGPSGERAARTPEGQVHHPPPPAARRRRGGSVACPRVLSHRERAPRRKPRAPNNNGFVEQRQIITACVGRRTRLKTAGPQLRSAHCSKGSRSARAQRAGRAPGTQGTQGHRRRCTPRARRKR